MTPRHRLFVAALTAAAVSVGCKDASPPPPAAATQAPRTTPSAPKPLPEPSAMLVTGPSLAPLVDAVKGAVVNVEVQARGPARQAPSGMQLDPFERFFGGPVQPAPPPVRQGAGSGFILDQEGRLLTNNHVVEGAMAIQVTLHDGRTFDAKVLGRDPLTDLALLQLQGELRELPTVPLGDSDAMRVGDWVLAIGNPFGLASSVSAGIISARARDIRAGPYDDFLQTDAAINPGNSGGPLFNLQGQVIGINTAIIGGGTGIGFAVPSNMAKALLEQLREGEVRRGWLGVGVQDATADLAKALSVPVEDGALITTVERGAPAARAGIQPDDIVVQVDDQPIGSARDLTRQVGFKAPETKVTLTYYRGNDKRQAEVTLGTRPDYEGVRADAEPQADVERQMSRLGLTVTDMDPRLSRQAGVTTGALIVNVAPGSPGAHADLQPGMVVVEASGKPIRSAMDLRRVLTGAPSKSTVLLRVVAGGARVLRAISVP